MPAKRYRWILTFLRYGLCVAALIFLYFNVPWHDYVRLDDGQETRVRLVERRDDELLIIRDGRPLTVPVAAAVHELVTHGGQQRRELAVEVGIRNVVARVDRGMALWAVLLFAPVPFMSAVRLIWMLAIQRVRLSYWNSVKFTFAGNFFNFALPGTTGGDLLKAYYLTRFTHRKTEAVTTVFLDRAIGLLSLVLLAGAVIVFTRDPAQFRRLGLTIAGICAGLAVLAVVVFSRRIRRRLRLRALLSRLPLSDQIQRMANATLAMRQHKSQVLLSLLITFALQSIVMIGAAIMAWALWMKGEFWYFFIYVSIGFLIAAVPISPPQAFGVMEYAYVQFFTWNGENTSAQAVALALAVRLIQLVWSLPGILVPLLGAHHPSGAELAELEQLAAAEPCATPADHDPGRGSAAPARLQ